MTDKELNKLHTRMGGTPARPTYNPSKVSEIHSCGYLCDMPACVKAQRDALLADAERYRWLRSRVPGGTYRIAGVVYSEGGAVVDLAIDAARAQEAGE